MPHDITLISTIAVGFALAFLFGFLATSPGLVPAGRLPGRGGGGRPLHPRLRRRSRHCRTVGRDRRHAADVRRGPAFLRGRSDGRAAGGDSRRHWPDRASPPASASASRWRGAGAWGRGWCLGLSLSVASTVVLLKALEERNVHHHRQRPHRHRLVDRRGSGHGPGPGAAAGVRRSARGPGGRRCACGGRPGIGRDPRPHAGQGGGVRRGRVAGRPARAALGAAPGGADRIARAVYALRPDGRDRHRLWLGRAL